MRSSQPLRSLLTIKSAVSSPSSRLLLSNSTPDVQEAFRLSSTTCTAPRVSSQQSSSFSRTGTSGSSALLRLHTRRSFEEDSYCYTSRSQAFSAVRSASSLFKKPYSFFRPGQETTSPPQARESLAPIWKLALQKSRATPGVDASARGTEFGIDGSPRNAGQSFKRHQIVEHYGLQTRDLRKLDLNSSVLPYIFVRPSTILVNFFQLKLLIQSDRVLVFDVENSAHVQSVFAYIFEHEVAEGLGTANLPYEFRALESVLISITSHLEAELISAQEPLRDVLRDIGTDITVDQEILRRLLEHIKTVGSLEQKARQVRDAIREVLDADDDLAAMYLSDRKNGKPHATENHDEVELLLESYEKICDGVVEACEKLQDDVNRTDQSMKSVLDATRNQIILLEVKLNIGMLGIACGTLIAGLYGMNLVNGMENSYGGFVAITSVCFTLSAAIMLFGIRKMKKFHRPHAPTAIRGDLGMTPKGNFTSAKAENPTSVNKETQAGKSI